MPTDVEHIQQYLEKEGWTVAGEHGRFRRLRPPEVLGLPGDYTLSLPTVSDAPDINLYIARVVTMLAGLYNVPRDQLERSITDDATILSIQVIDESTYDGTIPFPRFEGIVEKLRKTLLDTAAFAISQAPLLTGLPDEAYSYLQNCRFLQTAAGSYVANIELPSNRELVSPDLFGEHGLNSDEVNERLRDILSFALGPVMHSEDSIYQQEYLRDSVELLSIDVLKDVADLLDKTPSGEIKFSFSKAGERRVIPSGRLTEQRRAQLDTYVQFLRTRITEPAVIDMEGRIVELRSRNPERDRNYILVAGIVDGQEAYVAVRLSQRDYPTAISAHQRNRKVRVMGEARRMKTQFSITRLLIFEELEAGGS